MVVFSCGQNFRVRLLKLVEGDAEESGVQFLFSLSTRSVMS